MTLEEHWQQYRKACYPPEIPAIQEREVRAGFFQGCFAALTEVGKLSELPEDTGILTLKKLMDEAMLKCQERHDQLKARN